MICVLPSAFQPFCTPFEGQTGLLPHAITLFSLCHLPSPLGMLSPLSNCSQTFITAIADENPHEVRIHYAFPHCMWGNKARGEKSDLFEVKQGFCDKVNN